MLAELVTGDSLVHRLDPRIKILIAALFSVLVAVLNRFAALTSALALGLFIVGLAGVPKKVLLWRLVPVNIFILFLWFFLPFTSAGKPLFSWGPLIGTHEGVLCAARITIKSNAIMVVLIALVASTSVFTLGHALGALRVPAKMVHLLFFTFRYAHVIHQEYLRLFNAMKVRCFRPGTNLHTYKTLAHLLGMLLVRSIDRAERIRRAMLCRGFAGNLQSLGAFSIKGADVISLVLMLILIGILGLLEWTTAI
jgi:cobalt/nickel transport system permease protein